jgi:hypothetical protein
MYRPTETRGIHTRDQSALSNKACALALRLGITPDRIFSTPFSNLQCPSGGLLRQPFLSPLPKAIPEDLLP